MKKTIAIICAAVISGGVVAGLGYISKGFTDWSKENWQIKTNQSVVDGEFSVAPAEASDGIELSIMRLNAGNSASDDGIATTSLSDTYTVVAYVTPSDATDTVEFSLAWADPDSAFASGKDVEEYIELTANGLTATVKCLKPFGSQILLKCQGKIGKTITATCTLDYIKRADGSLGYPHGFKLYNGGGYELNEMPLGDFNWVVNPYLSAGTISGEFVFGDEVTVELNQAVKDNVSAACSGANSSYSFRRKKCSINNSSCDLTFADLIVVHYETSTTTSRLKQQLVAACEEQINDITISVPFEYKYDGNVLTSGVLSRSYPLDTNGLYTALSGLSLSPSELIF